MPLVRLLLPPLVLLGVVLAPAVMVVPVPLLPLLVRVDKQVSLLLVVSLHLHQQMESGPAVRREARSVVGLASSNS